MWAGSSQEMSSSICVRLREIEREREHTRVSAQILAMYVVLQCLVSLPWWPGVGGSGTQLVQLITLVLGVEPARSLPLPFSTFTLAAWKSNGQAVDNASAHYSILLPATSLKPNYLWWTQTCFAHAVHFSWDLLPSLSAWQNPSYPSNQIMSHFV